MTRKIATAVAAVLLGALLWASAALAQSSPGLVTGQVPTAAQWNSYFAAKQDYLGFTPLNTSSVVGASPIVATIGGGVVTLSCPTCLTSTGGFANPTGLIGMTAVNGVSTSGTRSDATHAIDPAIIPTWTGLHTFAANATINLKARTASGTTDTITSADNRLVVTYTNAGTKAVTLNVLAAGSGGASGGWAIIQNNGAGTATVTPSSGTINGAASLAVAFQKSFMSASDGTNAQALNLGLWAQATNDIFAIDRFYLLAAADGFPVNANTNDNDTTANNKSPFSVVNNYPTVHTGEQVNAGAFTMFSVGSGLTSPDAALIVSSQQSLWLTTSMIGDQEGVMSYVYHGVNSTGNAFTGATSLRANGSSQVAAATQMLEGSVNLQNGSNLSIARIHNTINQLDVGNSKYGFGYVSEGQIGALDTAYLVDTFDLSAGEAGTAPSWQYAFRVRSARNSANDTYRLTAAGVISLATWNGVKIGLAFGGTNADLSATGGTSQVLKQVSSGAAITVGQLANTDITGLGTMSTQNANAVAITGGTIAGLTGLAIRDTSAAFDVTIAAVSSAALSAGRTLTLNMQNVAHILSFGTTASTGSGIIFPNTATDTVAMLGVTQTFTGINTFLRSDIVVGTTFQTSEDSANAGPQVSYFRNSASPAASDAIGQFLFQGKNSGAATFPYGAVTAYILSPTASSEAGVMFFQGTTAGGLLSDMQVGNGVMLGYAAGTAPPGVGSLQVNVKIFAPNLSTTTAALGAALCWTTTTGEFQRDTNAGGCLVSAGRYKHDIANLSSGLDTVMAMRPVSFLYNDNVGIAGPQVGFIADEMAMAEPRLVGFNPDGSAQSVRYMQLTAVLTKAVQELKGANDNLRTEIDELKRRASMR